MADLKEPDMASENTKESDLQKETSDTVPSETTESQADTSGSQQETMQQNLTQETPEPVAEEEEYLDILGNGTLLKKILEKGHGSRALMGQQITIKWSKEIPEMEKTFPEEDLTFILGDGDVVQALDLVVALMNLGEKAQIITGYKYMYGDLGLAPDIPIRANFKLHVHLISNDGAPDYPNMALEKRFSEAQKKKERGNFLFKRREFSLALNSYVKAAKIVDPAESGVYMDESPEKLQEVLEFRSILLCNTSVVQMKVDACDAAIKSANEAVKLRPAHYKAYYRLGQAYEKKGNLDEAIKTLKVALKLDEENKTLHGDLARLTKLRKDAKESEQKMYSKMFWGSKPPSVNKTSSEKTEASLNSTSSQPKPSTSAVNEEPKPSTSKETDHQEPELSEDEKFILGCASAMKAMTGHMSEEDTRVFAYNLGQSLVAQSANPAQLQFAANQMLAMVPPDVRQALEEAERQQQNSVSTTDAPSTLSPEARKEEMQAEEIATKAQKEAELLGQQEHKALEETIITKMQAQMVAVINAQQNYATEEEAIKAHLRAQVIAELKTRQNFIKVQEEAKMFQMSTQDEELKLKLECQAQKDAIEAKMQTQKEKELKSLSEILAEEDAFKAHLRAQIVKELKARPDFIKIQEEDREQGIKAQTRVQSEAEMKAQQEIQAIEAHLRCKKAAKLKAHQAKMEAEIRIQKEAELKAQQKLHAERIAIESELRRQKEAELKAHQAQKEAQMRRQREAEHRALQELQVHEQSLQAQLRAQIEALGTDSGTDIDEAYRVRVENDAKKFSWLWKTGATVLGAGLVGIAGIGLYRYMNH